MTDDGLGKSRNMQHACKAQFELV